MWVSMPSLLRRPEDTRPESDDSWSALAGSAAGAAPTLASGRVPAPPACSGFLKCLLSLKARAQAAGNKAQQPSGWERSHRS